MEQKLNVYLSDLIVEYHKLQNYHWYVKGHDFFNAHAKLEEIYTAFLGTIDEVAETMLMNGMKPLASMKDFLAASNIKEANAELITSDAVYADLLSDFDYLYQSSIAIKKLADEQECFAVSATMDTYIAEFSKNIWMIKQSRM